VISSHLRVIEDRLVGKSEFKNFAEDISSFSGRDSKRDMESKDKSESIEGISDMSDRSSRIGSRMNQLFFGEMIFSKNIVKFKFKRFNGE